MATPEETIESLLEALKVPQLSLTKAKEIQDRIEFLRSMVK